MRTDDRWTMESGDWGEMRGAIFKGREGGEGIREDATTQLTI